ncbi:glycosyltransferase 87 family protein [Raineyella fluvialis]|uniref:DUF2029 domain-containing protein n=1 Tax=Raineyella fluvialis TaxID=2662261 RepID=A0A5Q2FG86_9ACTN|nr:glycosyltransferase 87 family protein [Raineyella fluvialis]QGF23316.1 DUF2029 domain-containing protein [Raineyella fluvialis]
MWLATRLVLLFLLAGPESMARGDATYYYLKVADLAKVGLTHTMPEYPTPVVWLLQLPSLLGGFQMVYVRTFVALMVLVDLALAMWLWLRGRRNGTFAAANFWTWFIFLIGPLVFARFDIIPAFLAAAALLLLARFPAVSGGLVALGAAIKLWPAALIAGLLGQRHGRWALWLGFGVTGIVLVAASVMTAGWHRLLSPVVWQKERGLQIESVWATPAMLNALVHPGRYKIHVSSFNAWEILGQGVSLLLLASTVATLIGGLAILALGVRAWRSRGHDLYAGAMVMTTVIAIMITTNKTLSPQYLVWLGGPLAVLLLVRPGRLPVADRLLVALALLMGVLTQLIFPIFYEVLNVLQPSVGHTLMTLDLAIRNLALVVFTVLSFVRAWVLVGASAPASVRVGSGRPPLPAVGSDDVLPDTVR